MKIIVKGLGAATSNDLAFLTSEHAVKYVEQLWKSTDDGAEGSASEIPSQKPLHELCREMKP